MRGLQTITIDRDRSPIMVHDRRSTVILDRLKPVITASRRQKQISVADNSLAKPLRMRIDNLDRG
jgi:hypothetical protein